MDKSIVGHFLRGHEAHSIAGDQLIRHSNTQVIVQGERFMGHRQDSAYSKTTNQLLDKFSLSIDKKILVQKIITAYTQIRKIESLAGPSRESKKLREIITGLQNQLEYTRYLAKKYY